jgi:LmbE family N-acetylglucosaminyl deacetylase
LLPLVLGKKISGCYNVLCLGAHCDDIEIGCGGTLLRLFRSYKQLRVVWVVFSGNEIRNREARNSARLFLNGVQNSEVIIYDFRDSFFPTQWSEIKECFEDLKRLIDPDLIFTHFRQDLHQDHGVLCNLTWNTFRNHQILEYEIPKYDGDLGSPNFFVPFDKKISNRKIRYLVSCFKTQRGKHWFTPDVFQVLMRIRGLEANSPGRFAEAFYTRKLLLDA